MSDSEVREWEASVEASSWCDKALLAAMERRLGWKFEVEDALEQAEGLHAEDSVRIRVAGLRKLFGLDRESTHKR